MRRRKAAGEAQTQTTDPARTVARLTLEPNVSLCLGRNVVIQWKKIKMESRQQEGKRISEATFNLIHCLAVFV